MNGKELRDAYNEMCLQHNCSECDYGEIENCFYQFLIDKVAAVLKNEILKEMCKEMGCDYCKKHSQDPKPLKETCVLSNYESVIISAIEKIREVD